MLGFLTNTRYILGMGKHSSKEEYNAYMREYMLARYHKRRALALEMLGGKCLRCGTKDDLHIDHIDPESKEDGLLTSRLHTASWSLIETELAKCQLLCQSCHKRKSKTDGSFEKDTGPVTCPCGQTFPSGRALGGHRGGMGACEVEGATND